MNRSRLAPLLTFAILFTQLAASRSRAEYPPDTSAVLTKQIDEILSDPALAAGFQGVEIARVRDRQVLYSHNAEHVFLPASNNKLLTGSAALALLGPDYRYKTEIKARVENGTITGDIVIIGSGDPTLSSNDLEQMAEAIKASGVTKVTGAIRYDASVFDNEWLGEAWNWNDEPYYYSAQISGLNVDRNVVLVSVRPGNNAGDSVKVTLTPGSESYLRVVNTATTAASGKTPRIEVGRERAQNVITVSGSMLIDESKPVTTAVTMENPAAYTASLFSAALKRAGVTLHETAISKCNASDSSGSAIAIHTSPALSEILKLMNKPSDNMIAECLLKTVGAAKQKVGTAGGDGTGTLSVRDWLVSIGLQPARFRQVDGSGLSRQNYVSPANIVKLLEYWAGNPQFKVFYNSLPIAGVDGTLKNRMKGTPAENNCHAKTGSLSQNRCLSGYVTSKNGVLLAFSIMSNNQLGSMTPCVNAENKIVELLAASNIPEQSSRGDRDE